MSVLELEQVTYSYPGAAAPALDDVTLEVEPGELVVVAGSSGSGKSTLLGLASGLVPHFHGGAFSGRATVAGMNTRESRPGQLAVAVGTLFQDPEAQTVMGTARAELAFGLENRGHAAAAVARGVEEAALALGIGHLLDRPLAELSGGELQRVALGAALAGRPALLVLDEPTSQLDPVAGDELIGSLRRLNEDSETAILLSEHRLERCLGLADRVIALEAGRIVCDAPPSAFLAWAVASAPQLATPGARLLSGLGLAPVPGVKAARASLRTAESLPPSRETEVLHRMRGKSNESALEVERLWHEVKEGPAILRGVSLTVGRGERVALMGRNGAGKSTLLKHAAGLMKPTRGKVRAAGRVALLLQNPNDYLIHDTVAEEASPGALQRAGLDPDAFGPRHPRDLSGGERQRLALAIVLDGDPAAVVCLDEPTRGMDRAHKDELATLLKTLDAAVVVATHDPEFAAAFADRVVLLADGTAIADGPVAEVLSGGTYFATEVARILGGAGGALTPEEGLATLAAPRGGACVSWQLASFGILAVALIGGFAWYERSNSDARTVALVATLAALAALGRIAFAAIPNVKPTTDIVLISGYALGGAPGFAVGAIAGLTSNFFFGQGPWTPWQMAAWGATAIIGAGLALITARRIGRWPLAIICGLVGFAFAAFQDIGDWVTYSDHSAAQLGVYVGKGVGFDFIHAAGCVVFALAFGPALIRSIQRFARRLHVAWGPAHPASPVRLGVVLAALAVLLASQPGTGAGGGVAGTAAAAQTPTTYLLNAQNSDGGFGPGPGQASTSLFAGWAALGLAAEGHNPVDVRHGGASLLAYVQSNPGGDPGSIERAILVLRAAGEPAGALLSRLEQLIRPNGSVQNQVNLTAFAVLALHAAGTAPPSRTLAWLIRQQDRDGGYNFATAGGTSDIDDTGAALEALAGAPGGGHAQSRAVAFLRRQQERDGGFPQEPSGGTNSQSTAWAVQGLIAAGISPSSVHRAGSPSPFAYLTGLIAPDGHIRYSRSSDQTPVWTTGQALTALAGRPLPLSPVARAAPAVRHHATGTPAASVAAAKSTTHRSLKKKEHANNRDRKAPLPALKTPPIHALAADAAAAVVLVFAPVNLG